LKAAKACNVAYVNIDVSIGTGLKFGRNQKVDNQSLQGCLGQIVVNAKPLFPEHELGLMVFLANKGQGIPMKEPQLLATGNRSKEGFLNSRERRRSQKYALTQAAEHLGTTRDEHAAIPDQKDTIYRNF